VIDTCGSVCIMDLYGRSIRSAADASLDVVAKIAFNCSNK